VTIGETKWGWLALALSTFRSQICNQSLLVALFWLDDISSGAVPSEGFSSGNDCARASEEVKRRSTMKT
jgi:hypothetical protein